MTTTKSLQHTAACAALWLATTVLLSAQTTAAKPAAATDSGIVTMSPFEVSDKTDFGYRKLNAVTTSRVGVPILKEPLAIEIISGELLKDFGVTEDYHVFRYSSSVTVGENEVGQSGIVTMRGFQMPRFFNGAGFSSASGTTPYLVMDNIDRVEIAKGAQGLFYGNTTPNGIANYITKKPQFTNAINLQLTAGNYRLGHAVLDAQGVVHNHEDTMAYRLISSYYTRTGRVDGQNREEVFIAPSYVWRPNSKFQFNAEINYTKQKIPYGTFARDFAINPQFYKDLTAPSQEILNFMKTKYGLADDAAAKAKIEERYGRNQQWNTFLVNWQADTLERTVDQPFQFTGDTVNWLRYSPRGDKFQVSLGNQDGDTKVFDSSLTFNPLDNFSFRYHWARMDTAANFVRHLVLPNGGLRTDGRVPTNNAQYINAGTNGVRSAYTDVQTLDAVYDFKLANIKHQILLGVELRRSSSSNGDVILDYTRAIPSKDELGNTLTGIDVYKWYDPFGGIPVPNMWQVVASPPRVTSRQVSDFKDYYVTYRASALDEKLDFMIGGRRVHAKQTGFDHDTWSVGAVYEVVNGFRVFASTGENFVFGNNYNIEGPGMTPQEIATRTLLNYESGFGTEIGVKTDWKDNTLSGSVSWFFDQRDGIIRSDYAKNIADPRLNDPNPLNRVTWRQNGGVVQVKGFDGDIAWTPNRNFQGIVNFCYEYEAKVVSDPAVDLTKPYMTIYKKTFLRRPQKNPIWKTNLIAKYNVTDGLFKNTSVGGAIRYSAEYNMTDSPTMDLIVPAETIIDLFATYRTKFGKTPTDLTLNLVNVTNQVNDLTRGDGFEVRVSVGFHL